MTSPREFEIVVYGATGYTGRLVAEYLNGRYGAQGDLKWAVAGRSADKLSEVAGLIGLPDAVPRIVADASDPASLKALAERTQVVLTTVGPYQLYGEGLISACVEAGTDYVDLCGETNFMHHVIETYDAKAKASGARIVFSCGFDSIPFDLGVFMLQQEAQKRFGEPAQRVKGRVRTMQGGFSGGTAASGRATAEAAMKNPEVFKLLLNHFALTPGFEGPEQPAGDKPQTEDDLGGVWVAPFIMAQINTRNIHRSNFLLDHLYGKDFVYDEMMVTGPGDEGKAAAEFVVQMNASFGGEGGPKPGEGPTKEERENGSYDVLFVGATKGGHELRVGVTGDKDPGYGSTSKMIAESAICLVKDQPEGAGGVFTPAPAMGEALIARLKANAGLTFDVESAK